MVERSDPFTPFQNWVLFYFLKHKEVRATAETLMDNMCLTALINFDFKKGEQQLDELVFKELIGGERLGATNETINYWSTSEGRFYVKQTILLPLLKAKQKDKVSEVMNFMMSKNPDEFLVRTLQTSFTAQSPNAFFETLSDYALNHIVPFMQFLMDLHDKFGDF